MWVGDVDAPDEPSAIEEAINQGDGGTVHPDTPEQYEIAEVRASRGVSRVMLFSKSIIQAEWEANAPLREAMAIKRERWRVLRAKRAAERATKQQRST
jgi:hypothetical protein